MYAAHCFSMFSLKRIQIKPQGDSRKSMFLQPPTSVEPAQAKSICSSLSPCRLLLQTARAAYFLHNDDASSLVTSRVMVRGLSYYAKPILVREVRSTLEPNQSVLCDRSECALERIMSGAGIARRKRIRVMRKVRRNHASRTSCRNPYAEHSPAHGVSQRSSLYLKAAFQKTGR